MKHRNVFTMVMITLTLMGATACQKKTQNTNTIPSSGVKLHQAVPNAFGSLSSITTNTSTSQKAVTENSAGATATSSDQSIPPEPFPVFTYLFTGTAPSLNETTVNVFERTAGVALPMPVDLRAGAGLGRMNFGNLADPTIENLAIRSGDEYWTVSPFDGSISMYVQNNPTVPMLKTETAPAAPPEQLKLSNTNTGLSSTDTASALDIANAYLAKQGISTSMYGQPMVTTVYGFGYPVRALDTISAMPVPTTFAPVQVLYPLQIKGQSVVQTSGDPIGMTLAVDLTSKKVTSLFGLTTHDYTQSAYDALTDFTAVKKLAEQGGYSGYYGGAPNGGTTTTMTLGTPERVLMSSYIYTDSRSRELYLPAFRFPISEPSENYPQWIVVPLVKDLPTDMPISIMAPGATSGSGSAGVVSNSSQTNGSSGSSTIITE